MKKPLEITFAPQDAIDTFEQEVDRLLAAIGHPEAFITDESQLWDFIIGVPGSEEDEEVAQMNAQVMTDVSELMKRQVSENEYLWRLAQELHEASVPKLIH